MLTQHVFFYAVNYQKLQPNFVEMGYSIISKNLNPSSTRSDFISTKLLCSNRDLPHEALGQSNNILNLNDSSLARRAIVFKKDLQNLINLVKARVSSGVLFHTFH